MIVPKVSDSVMFNNNRQYRKTAPQRNNTISASTKHYQTLKDRKAERMKQSNSSIPKDRHEKLRSSSHLKKFVNQSINSKKALNVPSQTNSVAEIKKQRPVYQATKTPKHDQSNFKSHKLSLINQQSHEERVQILTPSHSAKKDHTVSGSKSIHFPKLINHNTNYDKNSNHSRDKTEGPKSILRLRVYSGERSNDTTDDSNTLLQI